MTSMYVLFEHATGFSLFAVMEFEEVGMQLPQVEDAVTDLNKFRSIVKLKGFAPFKTAGNALDNINSISEGVMHEDLHLFLETNLPPSTGKKNSVILGVADSKIGGAISESFNVKCEFTGVVPELMRGIRHHFTNLVKGFTVQSAGKAQLGLGHSYSRSKVKFNVNRVDNMIIQSISLLDQLDKDINTFSMRIREWYSYHFPELIKIVPENFLFTQMVKFIKNRKDLTEDNIEAMTEILVGDADRAKSVFSASKSSMGMDISPIDLINIQLFASRVIGLIEYRRQLQTYLATKMGAIAPNLATLIGDQVGARLIAHAGSLTNLAKFPASTVQILGAEKALFRALKTKGNTPKYGLIFHSTFIGRAGAQNKGRISRYLANKCSIASRIDCFSESMSNIFGGKLRDQVEERLKFYEMGDIPRKNVDVMKEAIEELAVMTPQEPSSKKKNKRSLDTSVSKTKKKKNKQVEETPEEVLDSSVSPKKKKRASLDEAEAMEVDPNVSAKKSKKKKSMTNGGSH